jgi:hypothetical protein
MFEEDCCLTSYMRAFPELGAGVISIRRPFLYDLLSSLLYES